MAPVTKKVRFADKPKVSMFYKDDSVAWFSSRSIRKTKEQYFKEGKTWQQKGYEVLMEDFFQNPIQANLDAFTQLPDEDYLRGAETYLCDAVSRERHAMKSRTLQAVIDREIELKLEGKKTANEVAEELRLVSEKHSACARAFAQKIAKADELAATEENQDAYAAHDLVRRLSGKALKSSISASVYSIGNDWILSSVKNMIVGRQA